MRTNRVTWSDELYRIFGLSNETFGGTYEAFLASVHPMDRVRVDATIQRAAKEGEPFTVEHRIVRPDGSERFLHGQGEILRDAQGAPVGMTGTALDVTDRQRGESKFRDLLEAAPDGIVIVDKTGKIILVNSQTEAMFGYTRSELLSRPVEVLVPRQFAAKHQDHRAAYFADPKMRPMGAGLALVGRRKDGTEVPVEISLSPLQTEDGLVISASIRDITERRQAEEKLRRSERMLAEAERIAHIGSWEVDPATGRVHWSNELFRICGVSPPEVEPPVEELAKFIHPEDLPGLLATQEKALEDHQPFRVEHRIVRPDGSVRLIRGVGEVALDPAGNVVRLSGTGQDVTDSLAAEEKLRQQNRLYESLVEAQSDLGDGVAITEGARIVYANDALQRIYGYSAAELQALPSFLDIVAPEERAEVAARLQRRLAGEASGPGQQQLTIVRKDGRRVEIEYALKFLGGEGPTLRLISIIRDVTQRNRTEAEQRTASERLHEIEALREQAAFKTQFINTVAHELNTPLTPIRLQAHLLKESPQLAPELRKSITILDRNVERLSDLVKDVLEAARLQAGRLNVQPRATDANRVIRETIEAYEEPCRQAGVALESRLAPVAPAMADPPRLAQVMFNLLSNALKFTPRGGRIVVESLVPGNEVVIEVRDTGAGIRAEDVARLFQPFSQFHQQDDRPRTGTGLGLYICKGIIEQHHGRIEAESPGLGAGTTFRFSLPSVSPGLLPPTPAPLPTPSARDADRLLERRLRELI
jgi:PAS domain S-box-containing protein